MFFGRTFQLVGAQGYAGRRRFFLGTVILGSGWIFTRISLHFCFFVRVPKGFDGDYRILVNVWAFDSRGKQWMYSRCIRRATYKLLLVLSFYMAFQTCV